MSTWEHLLVLFLSLIKAGFFGFLGNFFVVILRFMATPKQEVFGFTDNEMQENFKQVFPRNEWWKDVKTLQIP